MKFLLDEDLHDDAAKTLDAFGQSQGDSFTFILRHKDPGTEDDNIPALCKSLDVDVLITANVRDFGARKRYFQALVASGIHVLVLRPGKLKLFPERQAAFVLMHYERVRTLLDEAPGPSLVRVRQSGADRRTLDELIADITGSEALP